MKYKIKTAFTLVELIVGMSISILLMGSVGLFVTNGVENILNQQKNLTLAGNTNLFIQKIYEHLERIDKESAFNPQIINNGILFKRRSYFGDVGFSYIGITESNDRGIFCPNEIEREEELNTKHLYIKTFLPTEQINTVAGTYKSDTTNHTIKNTTDNQIIIGKGIFGNDIIEGGDASKVYLNSPTGLALAGNILFIADTGNNRILSYDTDTNNISTLLDENDGIYEPTGLEYNASEHALYIANSGNAEVLKYGSKQYTSPPPFIISDMTPSSVSLTDISFSLFKDGNAYDIDSNITFENISTSTGDTIHVNQNTLNYSFSGGTQIRDDSKITLRPSSLSDTGNYFFQIRGKNDANIVFDDYKPYFVNGDQNLLTSNDNILEVHSSGTSYIVDSSGTTININNINFDYAPQTDILLKTPIESFERDITNGNISLILKAYKKYDCINDNKRIIETFILKK